MSMTAARLYLVGVLSAPLLGFARITATHPTNVEFSVAFDGVGAEGIDDLWRGSLQNPSAGMITIRVEHLAPESHQPMTVGPIHAEVFVSRDDLTQSFGADVTGSIDSAGVLHLTGTVDVGPAAGTPVDVTAQLDPRRLNGHGLIRFLSLTARR
jgi:hypothetical protein